MFHPSLVSCTRSLRRSRRSATNWRPIRASPVARQLESASPPIAVALAPILFPHVPLFRVTEAPNLIDLHALRGEVAHRQIVVLPGERARVGEQAEDRHLGRAEHPLRG